MKLFKKKKVLPQINLAHFLSKKQLNAVQNLQHKIEIKAQNLTPKEKQLEEFRGLIKEGKEQAFLIERSARNNEKLIPSIYYFEKELKATYNRDEIFEMLSKKPLKFFERGWLFPSKNWSSILILWATGDSGTGYSFNSCLPQEFWEDAFMMRAFVNAANLFWDNFEFKNKPQTDEPNEEEYLRLGFKIQIIHKQLVTLDNLQKELTFLEMAFENNKIDSAFERKQKQIKIESLKHKIGLLVQNPLFQVEDQKAQTLYKKTLICAEQNIRNPRPRGIDYDY